MSLDGRVALTSTGYLPLALAMWCVDCEQVFKAGVEVCPACASGEIYPLAGFLDDREVNP